MVGVAAAPRVDPKMRNPYKSPPGADGNDGKPPSVYDSKWQNYTNLNEIQISSFQSFPQDLQYYATQKGWEFEQKGFSTSGINSTYIKAMRAAVDSLVAAINASPPTITTRAQIDLVLAGVTLS